MEQILQTESQVLHSKATAEEKDTDAQEYANGVKKSKEARISDNIQTLSDHLKKVDEKSDMTALEENDTKTIHPKVGLSLSHCQPIQKLFVKFQICSQNTFLLSGMAIEHLP